MAYHSIAVVRCFIVALLVTLEFMSQSSARPSFSVTPSDTIAVEGLPVTFYCTIANRERHLVFWNIDQRSVENSAGKDFTLGPNTNTHDSYPRFRFVGNPGIGEFNLRVDNVTSRDAGLYTCLVSDPSVSAYSALEAGATLTVVDTAVAPSPNFPMCSGESEPNAQGEYEEGETLSLTCSSMGGIPLPTLSWARVKWNNVVEDLPSQTIVRGDVVTTVARVKLSSVDHQSYFRCTESHPTGALNQKSCTALSGPQDLLKVRFEPKVTVSPKTVGIQLLETVSVELKCKAYGYPTLTLGPRFILPLNKTSEPVPTSELGTTAIRVELTTDDVGKDFYCRATNELGLGEDRVEIQRLGALPPWLVLVIVGAIAVVVLIFIVVISCILCVDRSNPDDERRKDQLRYSVNRSRPTSTREAGDGDFIEVYDEDMAPIEDFQGGNESFPLGDEPKNVQGNANNDFETGEKGPMYQNVNEAFQEDEVDDTNEAFQRDSVHSNSLSRSYPSSEPIMDPDLE